MRLIVAVDIDMEESDLDEHRIRAALMQFARNLLIIGVEDLQI